jgi:hypothetical protein
MLLITIVQRYSNPRPLAPNYGLAKSVIPIRTFSEKIQNLYKKIKSDLNFLHVEFNLFHSSIALA